MVPRSWRLDHRTEWDGCLILGQEAPRGHKSVWMSEEDAMRVGILVVVAEQACARPNFD
jgi:hypothetical protein